MFVFHDLGIISMYSNLFFFSSKLILVFESFHYIISSSSLKSWPLKINDFVAILGF